jgi:hypothetical protein
MYAFLQKHLSLNGSPEDDSVEYLTEKELQKTSTGQLSNSLGGETVFSLNMKEAQKYITNLQNSRKDLNRHNQVVRMSAKQLSGYREPCLSDKPVFTGRFQRKGYAIEKYFIKGEGDYAIPFLLFKPASPSDKAIVYVNPEGKNARAAEGDEIEWLTNKGFTVLAPDLTGIGELGNGSLKGDAYIQNISYNMLFTAMLIGRSITGIQAGDIVKLANMLKKYFDIKEIYGVARGELSPALLHAASFDPVISRILLLKPLSSYRSVVVNRFYNPVIVHSLVPGALKYYDLPDLAVSLAPRKLTLAGVTDCNGKYDDTENISYDLDVITKGYLKLGADNKLKIIPGSTFDDPDIIFSEWIK